MQFSVIEANLEKDRATIIRLWRSGFDNINWQESKYIRQYLHNPFGTSHVFLLKRGEEIIGSNGIVVKRWFINGENIEVALFADLVVAPGYRTLGPAMVLVRNILDEAKQRYKFTYGFPNPNSRLVYSRCNIDIKRQISRYVKPTRITYYLKRKFGTAAYIPGIPVDIVTRVWNKLTSRQHEKTFRGEFALGSTSAIDSLWEHCKRNNCMMEVRDSSYLHWRFVDNKMFSYEFFSLYRRDTNKLVAYCVFHHDANHVTYIDDFLCEDFATHFPIMVVLLTRRCMELGSVALALEFSGDENVTRILDQTGFRCRESHVVAFAKGISFPENQTEMTWYITSADRD